MSQQFDSTDYIARTTSLPDESAFTIGAWLYFDSLPASDQGIFHLEGSGSTQLAVLNWRGAAHNKMRLGHANLGVNITDVPPTGEWIYMYLQSNGSNVNGGWKQQAEGSFQASRKNATGDGVAGTPNYLHVGGNVSFTSSFVGRLFRLDLWGEYVTEANILLAAATDLGYTSAINSHLPLTSGIGSPWSDTSGNGRDWTSSGSFSDAADPSLGGSTVPLSLLRPRFVNFQPGFSR